MKNISLKLSANISMLFTEHTLLERFQQAARAGFNAVEIQFPYEEDVFELRDVQQANHLQVPLINVPAGDLMDGGLGIACLPKERDAVKRGIEQAITYAQALGVKSINLLAGRCPKPEDRARYYDVFLENLDYCADQLSSVGIRTVFEAVNTEAMPDFLINHSNQQQQVLKDLNRDDVWLQYDIYHMHVMHNKNEHEPIEKQLTELLPRIGHIQFADNPGRHQPSTGDIPIEHYMQLIQKQGYKHWVGAEYIPSAASEITAADGEKLIATEETLDWMEWSVWS